MLIHGHLVTEIHGENISYLEIIFSEINYKRPGSIIWLTRITTTCKHLLFFACELLHFRLRNNLLGNCTTSKQPATPSLLTIMRNVEIEVESGLQPPSVGRTDGRAGGRLSKDLSSED